MRRSPPITLTDEELRSLRRTAGSRKSPARVRLRARILLDASEGRSNREISRSRGVDPATVSFWRQRFQRYRLDGGLEDALHPGRRTQRLEEASDRILHATYHEPPERGPRWTTRTLASHLGVNHMLVHRVWKAHGVALSGQLSSPRALPPRVSRRRVDLFGVFLEPPRRAVVFGVRRLLAGDLRGREEQVPVPNQGISGGFLFRPGTSDGTELLTILDRMETFVGRPENVGEERHDLLALLRQIEERTGPETEIHVFAEHPADPDSERLKAWMDRHPRYVLHGFRAGSGWRDALQEFVRPSSTPATAETGLSGVPLFVTEAAKFVAGRPSGGAALVWSLPLAPSQSLESSESEGARPAEPTPSGATRNLRDAEREPDPSGSNGGSS